MRRACCHQEGEILSKLPGAELAGLSDEALEALEEGGMAGLTRVVSAMALFRDDAVSTCDDSARGLDHALRLMQVGSASPSPPPPGMASPKPKPHTLQSLFERS